MGPVTLTTLLLLLAAHGPPDGAQDVLPADSAVQLLARADEMGALAAAERHALRAAVARAVARDPGEARHLAQRAAGLAGAVRCAVADGLADGGRREGLPALTDLLGVDRATDPFVLEALARLGGALPGPHPDGVLDPVRFAFEHADGASRRAAVRALGALGDEAHVPDLIELLDADDRGLAGDAHAALVAITGIPFPARSRQWRSWYEHERAFLDGPFAARVRDLSGRDPARRAAAIAAIASGRLGRHERARALAAALPGLSGPEDEPLALCAVSALRTLGSTTPLPILADLAANDPRPAVAAAAEAARAALEPTAPGASGPTPGSRAPRAGPRRGR